MKLGIAALVLLAIAVPLAGEFKFFPFRNEYRVSLAPPVLFFFLLWMRRIPPIFSGFVAGSSVVLFRSALGLVYGDAAEFGSAIGQHYPAFFYYVAYALLFQLTGINKLHHRPLLVGLLGIVVELGAGVSELLFRVPGAERTLSVSSVNEVLLIAVFRSFFVLGFFNLLKLREVKLMERQRRMQVEHMMMLTSNLYVEAVQLQKTMANAETITRDCYILYQEYKERQEACDSDKMAAAVLKLAGQVHEIKKDNQRIYAGLSHIISGESVTDYMEAKEIGELIVKANRKYAGMLDKRIDIRLHIEGEHPPYHIYTVLSLLNNLVANAVEAIPSEGEISIGMERKADAVEFRVTDSGPGVAASRMKVIFQPGFTTKFDSSGKPSTGIGLPYVKQTVESLDGTIRIRNKETGTGCTFELQLPIAQIAEKG